MEITKQRLTHGKALCGKVFKNFVETFNWLVDFGTNLKGDKDTANQSGHITVDNADPKHPVIRCDGCASEGGVCVTSLNEETGDVKIVGGSGITVDTNDKTITISYEEGKVPDEDGDPCAHDPSQEGGVSADDGGAGGAGGGGGAGGVAAEGDSHSGDDNCNCN